MNELGGTNKINLQENTPLRNTDDVGYHPTGGGTIEVL
jgi:hypothetical protein